MKLEYLEKEQRLIEEYIERFGCDGNAEKTEPIYDGVVDCKKYLESAYRICWALKEPCHKGDGKMDYIRDDLKMAQSLNEPALINVNKMPANSHSNDNDIAEQYEHWKPILFWQLRQYDPHIIIFENTFKYFQEDLGIKNREKRHEGHVDYVAKNSMPSYTTCKSSRGVRKNLTQSG
jgi:hypothetical protein